MNKLLGSVLVLGAVVVLSATTWEGFDFRRLGNYPNSFQTYPQGVNASKTIVGFYQPKGGFDHDYLQRGKNFKTIEPPGVLSSYLEGINDEGTAVGGYCDTLSCNPEEAQHGFRYREGQYTKIDYPMAGTSLAPRGINNHGQIVGGYCPGATECLIGRDPSKHAFLLDDGVFTTLDYPSAIATLANAINDSGTIVGFFEDSSSLHMLHGYRYRKGVFKQLDFPNANWTLPLGINNAGTISGIYLDNTTAITHGFIYSNGVFTQVDVPGSTATGLGGISNKGDVTATANVNNLSTPFIGIPRP